MTDAWRVIAGDHSPGIRPCLGCDSVGIATHAGSKSAIDGCTRRQPYSPIPPGKPIGFPVLDIFGDAVPRATREQLMESSACVTGAFGLVCAQGMQTVRLSAWLYFRQPGALQNAAEVRALGLIEIFFSYAVSRKLLEEKVSPTGIAGGILIVVAGGADLR